MGVHSFIYFLLVHHDLIDLFMYPLLQQKMLFHNLLHVGATGILSVTAP